MFGKKKKASAEGREAQLARRRERVLGSSPRPPLKAARSGDIARYLVEENLLQPVQARAAAMDAQSRRVPVATILGEQGTVPRASIVRAMESIDSGMLASGLDYDVRLPRKILREMKIVCHAQTDERLILSTMSNISLVRMMLDPYLDGREIKEVPFSWARWEEFEQGIDRIIEPDAGKVAIDDEMDPTSVVPDLVEDAEVLDLLVAFAAAQNVSDIHIEPEKQNYRVFFRFLGKLKLGHTGPIEQYNRVCALVKDRSHVDPMETRIPQDGSFSTHVRGRPYDVRVATVPSDGKEKITMRILDPIRAQMPLSVLGITLVEDWKRICGYRNGLVLIVGATGSGKTTTLNATIREMDRFGKSIYTAEDPVEYRIPYVTHVQMNEAVNLNFARALKAFMRSDPDVIVMGEIRDTETAAKAIQAAETGHLVIATIHAETVPMALARLKGLGVNKEDFEMLLRGVLVQFLVRTLCGECRGAGCENCYGEGYAGRTVVSEIARVSTPADVSKMMSADPADKYWRPLWEDLESKIVNKVTDGREIYRTFSSELEEMAKHSDVLAKVLSEERAKRESLSSNRAVANVSSLSKSEQKKQRAIALAALEKVSVPREVAEAETMSRDGEMLGASEAQN